MLDESAGTFLSAIPEEDDQDSQEEGQEEVSSHALATCPSLHGERHVSMLEGEATGASPGATLEAEGVQALEEVLEPMAIWPSMFRPSFLWFPGDGHWHHRHHHWHLLYRPA